MIVVECNSDQYLVNALGFRKVRHCTGKGDVLRFVEKREVVIGIIDEDPGKSQPSNLTRFRKIDSHGSLSLFVNSQNEKCKLIKISPDLEGWFLERAKKNGISLKEYRLPDTKEGLHLPHIERKQHFGEFVRNLIEVDEEAKCIREWITIHEGGHLSMDSL